MGKEMQGEGERRMAVKQRWDRALLQLLRAFYSALTWGMYFSQADRVWYWKHSALTRVHGAQVDYAWIYESPVPRGQWKKEYAR